MDKGEIVLYQPDDITKLEVRLEDETVWLSQMQMAELFQTTRNNVTMHISNIFKEGELEKKVVSKESLLTTEHSFHDRFLVIDDIVYHIGASLKDLGKKLFAFSRIEIDSADLLKRI